MLVVGTVKPFHLLPCISDMNEPATEVGDLSFELLFDSPRDGTSAAHGAESRRQRQLSRTPASPERMSPAPFGSPSLMSPRVRSRPRKGSRSERKIAADEPSAHVTVSEMDPARFEALIAFLNKIDPTLIKKHIYESDSDLCYLEFHDATWPSAIPHLQVLSVEKYRLELGQDASQIFILTCSPTDFFGMPSCGLVIRNLPFDLDLAEFRKFLVSVNAELFGEVEIFLKMRSNSASQLPSFSGVAFLTFKDIQTAKDSSVQLHGLEFKERKMEIEFKREESNSSSRTSDFMIENQDKLDLFLASQDTSLTFNGLLDHDAKKKLHEFARAHNLEHVPNPDGSVTLDKMRPRLGSLGKKPPHQRTRAHSDSRRVMVDTRGRSVSADHVASTPTFLPPTQSPRDHFLSTSINNNNNNNNNNNSSFNGGLNIHSTPGSLTTSPLSSTPNHGPARLRAYTVVTHSPPTFLVPVEGAKNSKKPILREPFKPGDVKPFQRNSPHKI